MKKACILIFKLAGIISGAAAAVFAVLQAVYWLNLDNKFMFVFHHILNRITDRVPRDRRF